MKDQGKLVEGGRFRVFMDGTVHRIKNGTEKVATQSVLKLKSGHFYLLRTPKTVNKNSFM